MPDTLKNRTDVKKKKKKKKKNSKVVTHRRQPLQCRRYSQAIVILRSLQFRYLPQCVVRVRDLTSLAVVCRQWSLQRLQRNCDDLKTTRDGLARNGNVKKMRVAVSNEIWTESQQIVLPSPNFQHAENLPSLNATDNFGRLRSLPDSSATTDGNTRWLAANSKLQFAA